MSEDSLNETSERLTSITKTLIFGYLDYVNQLQKQIIDCIMRQRIFFFCSYPSSHGAILRSKSCQETYGPQIHMQMSAGII